MASVTVYKNDTVMFGVCFDARCFFIVTYTVF